MTRWRKPEELVHNRVPGAFCPFCFILVDAVTGLQKKEMPEPGDFTICINCGGVMRYSPDMQLDASSLLDIPMASRMGFARIVTEVKNRGPFRRDNSKPF